MKKNIFYLLLVLVISLMAACSENKTNTQVPATADAKSKDQDKSVTTEMKLVKDGKLTFAMSGLLKPLNYKENQELVGFDVEIGKEISKRIGLEANPVTNPWETIIQGLRGNKYDAIIGSMTATEERSKQVDFSIPYYVSGATVFISSENKEIKTVEDLKGKTIGVMQASTYVEDAKKYTDKIKEFPSEIYALQDLPPGRLDAVITDRIVGISAMQESGLKIQALGEVIKREEIAVAINKDNEVLLEAINKAIEEMVKDGTYKEISMKWFGKDLLE
ncbi:ABC transporter substrate-binding protein [Lysinibacillus capsici]|uniref:ABC transporter substrate-binding protein n=1 Tax=Lysinibacillus capsici TaxID=2115968 RepID=UPI0006CA334A|nr:MULTISPECIES: ABC transporter substrate-binding protein [Lysinibacillus]MED3874870.1 ABC transporter substrate-binding protein [Lysinibacillus capsici]WPK03683.1 ABC transporter substrate-binding protein [Lysinibacillus capsici]